MILVVISIRMTCWIRVSWLTLPTECMHNWIAIPLHVILSSIRKPINWTCIFMMWWDSTITHSCVHVHMASCITGFLATVHVERILFKRDIKLLFCISTLVLGYYRSNYEHSSAEYWSAFAKVGYYAFIQTWMNIHRYIYLWTQCSMWIDFVYTRGTLINTTWWQVKEYHDVNIINAMHTGMCNCSVSPHREHAWLIYWDEHNLTTIPILFACFSTLWPFLCLVTFLMFFITLTV